MPHVFLQASSARTPASLKRIVHRFVFSATRSHVNTSPSFDAAQECFVWFTCLKIHKHQDDIHIPAWFDSIIPPCIRPCITMF